ncbi:MAG TPA: M56 family metallopeptidase [Pirellulales bacterium]|nr:M56 family metallopeptidase [Pirellulales bacterium]
MSQFLQNFELWGEAWITSLARASWQGAIAIALVWAITRWPRFLSARVACWLWRLACLKLLVALFWIQPLSLPVLPAEPAAPVAPETVSSHVALPVAGEPPAQAVEQFDAARPVVPMQGGPGPFYGGLLLVLWVAGAVVSLGGIARQWLAARRLTASATPQVSGSLSEACRQEADRLGLRRPPRLLLSPRVDSPLLAGIWRPAIVLPARLEAFDAGELRLMLAHELAHHRRRDLAWNWLPTAVRALFFFHPLVWLMVRRWSEAQEAACDELLIQGRLAQPVEYGRLLLKLAAREPLPTRSALSTASVLGAFRNLERRMIVMSRVRPYSFRRLALAAGVFALIVALSVVPWRLAPQAAAAAVAADDKPDAAKQPEALPGKIYVWVILDLSSDAPFPHNYQGVIEVDPNTGSWRKVGPLGQRMRLSPDSSRVAYSEFKPQGAPGSGGTSDLFLADIQNPQPIKLMEGGSLLAWSPDGRRLLYHVNDGSEGWYGTSWLLELATKEKQKLPIPETEQVEDWTSNGNWLVTISGRHSKEKNGYQLYMMHPDATGERRITQDRSANLYPRFSPDGKQIAYHRFTLAEKGGLWIVDVEGSNARQVLAEQENATIGGLCWSPDGRSLAIKVVENINEPRKKKARLEIVAAAGGEPRALQLKDVTVIHFMQMPEWRIVTADPPHEPTVRAQDQPPRRGQPAIPGGPMGAQIDTPLQLLSTSQVGDEVRKELAISEEQEKQIQEAFAPLKELNGDLREAQKLAPEDHQKRLEEILKKRVEETKLAEEKVNRILKPEQRLRYKQLWLQFQGMRAFFQPELVKELGLTREQQDKMREIAAAARRPEPGQPRLQDLSQQEQQQFVADWDARKEKAKREMLHVLADEQKTKFAELTGKEFAFPRNPFGEYIVRPTGERSQQKTQEAPRGRVGDRLRPGPRFGTSVELLRSPEVRKELAVSDEQTQEIEEAFAPLLELSGATREAQNLSPEERQKRFEETNKKGVAASKLVAEKVDQILNPQQRTRLKQLWLQWLRAGALIQPEVVEELGLTQEQQDNIGKILKVVQNHRQKAANPPPGQPGFQDFSQAELDQWRNELLALEDKAEAETLAVLTDEQEAKLAEMKGKEFDFPARTIIGDRPGGQRPTSPKQ